MQIFIRGISIYTTCNTQTINDIETTDSIRTLYLILNNIFNMSFQHYYLHYQSKILDHLTNKKLSDYGIGKESTIEIHFRNSSNPINFTK
tara:strand:+ start:1730 stop:1999 length:270 start_codon:yes stop_codon:yes gene_type:complete